MKTNANTPNEEISDEMLKKVAGGAVNIELDAIKRKAEKIKQSPGGYNSDREAIQKEINASIAEIDDNALLTFNGKFLGNGARTCKGFDTANVIFTE